MESKLCRVERLIQALELLAGRTAAQLAGNDFNGVLDSLSRADALVADLSPNADELRKNGALPAVLLNRARALVNEHQKLQTLVSERVSSLQQELKENTQASSRLKRIKPAYSAYTGADNHTASQLRVNFLG